MKKTRTTSRRSKVARCDRARQIDRLLPLPAINGKLPAGIHIPTAASHLGGCRNGAAAENPPNASAAVLEDLSRALSQVTAGTHVRTFKLLQSGRRCVGHARLILERFGKFWGAFSVIDLFLLNALTIVTEFIGISLALDYLGLPKDVGVLASALLVMAAVSTGNFRRFERFAVFLVFGSLLLVPVIIMVHPPISQMVHDFAVPRLPQGAP